MHIGDGLDQTNYQDFKVCEEINIVRLANWLLDWERSGTAMFTNGIGREAAINRVSAFFKAHLCIRPTTMRTCPWRRLSELYTHIANCGPNCSQSDIADAIYVLPEMPTGEPLANSFWDKNINPKED